MNEMFVDMNRTVCRCVERRGRIRGALLVVARWAGGETTSTRALEALAPRDASATTTSEIWVAVDDGSEPSAEERLRAQAAGRARDARVAACLVVSALREADARAAAIAIGEAAPEAELGIYRQLCELRHEDLARGPG